MRLREDLSDVTGIVATHNRKTAIEDLIRSLNIYYPKMPLIIVDSSNTKNNDISSSNYIYIKDSGISLQRNIALDKVKTNLFLLLDDDYVLNEKTDIEKMIELMIKSNHQIVGGCVNNLDIENFDFHGTYEIIDDVLYHFIDYEEDVESKQYDAIFNFFLAETEVVRSIGGRDDALKYAREHDDFFLNAKEKNISIGYTNKVIINHKSYTKYHGGDRSERCINHFLSKRNIKNKVEIRLIKRNGEQPYISYHGCFQKVNDIPNIIRKKIISKYGYFMIKQS